MQAQHILLNFIIKRKKLWLIIYEEKYDLSPELVLSLRGLTWQLNLTTW